MATVDDQSGDSVLLLHDTQYTISLSGGHTTRQGDYAAFAVLDGGSCAGPELLGPDNGGVIDAALSFSATLPVAGGAREEVLFLLEALLPLRLQPVLPLKIKQRATKANRAAHARKVKSQKKSAA